MMEHCSEGLQGGLCRAEHYSVRHCRAGHCNVGHCWEGHCREHTVGGRNTVERDISGWGTV